MIFGAFDCADTLNISEYDTFIIIFATFFSDNRY